MKTQAVIKLKRSPKFINERDFLELVFFQKRHHIEVALRLLDLIGKKRVGKRNWKEIVSILGVSKSQYYYVLGRLRSVGLIDFNYDEGVYVLSSRFSKSMERMIEYWEGWKERLERG